MIRVFTSSYLEPSETRCYELLRCLKTNLNLTWIQAVHVFLEGNKSEHLSHPKAVWRSVKTRPTYQDFFTWANSQITTTDNVSIIANSDIYFDETIMPLAKSLKTNQCAALSRWDVRPDGSATLFDRNDSQDVWIFRGKIRPVVSDYLMGVPRCDNRLLYELRQAGYEVINPAFSVRAFHLHAGERTEYPGQINGPHVEGPYEYLWPHNLMNLPARMLHNIRHPDTKLGGRIDWRKLQRTLPWRGVSKLKRLLVRS